VCAVGGSTDGGLRVRRRYASVPAERVGPVYDTAREVLAELIGQDGVPT
jgi:hypothetical protein